MASNQEGVLASLLAQFPGMNYAYNEAWHALFDDASIQPGTFNERLLAWINAQLSSAHESLAAAKQAYAEANGFVNWGAINTITTGAPPPAPALDFTLPGNSQYVPVLPL